MANEVKKDMVVSISYTLRDTDGEILDQADSSQPLDYLHGYQNIIPGLESKLEGLKVGDSKTVEVPADEAYGGYEDELVLSVPKSNFPPDFPMQEGIEFETDTEQGRMAFRVISIEEDEVVVDGNHPLAGEDLVFEIKIEDIREATAQEKAHGHVHSHGHDH